MKETIVHSIFKQYPEKKRYSDLVKINKYSGEVHDVQLLLRNMYTTDGNIRNVNIMRIHGVGIAMTIKMHEYLDRGSISYIINAFNHLEGMRYMSRVRQESEKKFTITIIC